MKDLAPGWIKNNLIEAKNDLCRAEVAYCALKDKRTCYAAAINRIIEAKRKVVQVWEQA